MAGLEPTALTSELEIAWLRQRYLDFVDEYAVLSKEHARLVLEHKYVVDFLDKELGGRHD